MLLPPHDESCDSHHAYTMPRSSCCPHILSPDWLAGAEYLGQQVVGKVTCNVWTKAEFIGG